MNEGRGHLGIHQATVRLAKDLLRRNSQNHDVDICRVSFASCAGCMSYLGGDHPEGEIRADNNVLGERTKVLLTVNRGSCLHHRSI